MVVEDVEAAAPRVGISTTPKKDTLGDVALHNCTKNSHAAWPLIICLV